MPEIQPNAMSGSAVGNLLNICPDAMRDSVPDLILEIFPRESGW